MSDDRLEKIRALLALAESTTFPDEAATFNAKAAELMARYAIDDAMLARSEHRHDRPEERRIVVHRPYAAQKALLVCEVAGNFGCRAVRFAGEPGEGHEFVSVVGFSGDLRLVETLVTSLFVQLGGTMVREQPTAATPAQSASWRRSYIGGFVCEVVERLTAQRAAAVAESDSARPVGDPAPSVALVLADREHQVADDFARRYPRVRTSRVSVGSSAAGHRSGRAAGSRADLGAHRLGGSAALRA